MLLCRVLRQREASVVAEHQVPAAWGCWWEGSLPPSRGTQPRTALAALCLLESNDRQGLEGEGGGEDLKLIWLCDCVQELLSAQRTDTR